MMVDIPLDVLIAFVMAGSMIIMLLSLVLLRLTLTRRLKRELQATGDYWDTGTVDFGFANTAVFAWACAIPYVQRLKRFQLIYQDLDVRSFANWFERAAAYGTIGGVMIFFLSAPFFYLFKP